MDRKRMIEDFFQRYEEIFNKAVASPEADLTDALHSFTSCFIVAGPSGVTCSENDEQFRVKLKQGLDFYRKIGTLAMHIHSMDVQMLGENHAVNKVHWNYAAVNKENHGVSITFDVYYLLQTINNQVKIFAYITGDEQRALKEQGIVSEFALKD